MCIFYEIQNTWIKLAKKYVNVKLQMMLTLMICFSSSGNFLVHALTYVSGTLLHDACPKPVPAEWYRVLGEHLAKVDKAMLVSIN